MPDRTQADAVCHVASLYHRGIICPAEMWYQVVRVLTPSSTRGILDSLPEKTRDQLIGVFADRPSLPVDPELAATTAVLMAWLRRGRA